MALNLKIHNLIFLLFLCGMGANLYLLHTHLQVDEALQQVKQKISQTSSLIQLASKKQKDPDKIQHRLNSPTSRLAMGLDFQKLNQFLKLQQLDFKISPEDVLATESGAAPLTKSTVTLQFTHHADQPIYALISHILEKLPGAIFPQQITLWRDLQSETPLIKGRFMFEWVKKAGIAPHD